MIVIDANLLLYAYSTAAPEHRRARGWVEEVFSGEALVGLPWLSVAAFIRVLSNANLHGERFTVIELVEIVERWIGSSNVRLLSPGERHRALFQEMLLKSQARGPMTTDAELAALTIEYGGVLYTTDRDFSRFPGLRWKNPLISGGCQ